MDEKLCSAIWPIDKNIPKEAEFKLYSSSVTEIISGIAINGGAFFGAISRDGVDPINPTVYGKVKEEHLERANEITDTCMTHPNGKGDLHYHMWSPCIIEPEEYGTDVYNCREDEKCNSTDPFDYSLEAYEDHKRLTVLGLAKDGHIIWGPYKDDETLWTDCEVDMCNGKVVDGTYGYVSSTFHPYLVGCWGPGTNSTLSQSCSSKSRSCPEAPKLEALNSEALNLDVNLEVINQALSFFENQGSLL